MLFASSQEVWFASFGCLSSPGSLLPTLHGLLRSRISYGCFKWTHSLAIRIANIAKDRETSQEVVYNTSPYDALTYLGSQIRQKSSGKIQLAANMGHRLT